MTTAKVVDASVLAAICFDEPAGPAAALALQSARLLAPAILDFEMTHICWLRIRRDPAARSAFLLQYAVRHDFAITRLPVKFDGVVELARTTNLSAYDASYLWLARNLGVDLVTLDAKLEKAARTPH